MHNSDATPAYRPEPRAAFDLAMETLHRRRERLAASIHHGDVEDVEQTARNAVNVWLAGRAALRRLVEKVDATIPHLAAARGLLEASRRALLEVLALAATTLAGERLHRSLTEVRAILVSASELAAEAAPPKTG
jgi:hypothetical protein